MCYIVDGFDEGNKEKYWAMWECDLRTRLRNLISNFLLAYESIKIVATLMSTPLRVCLFVSLYPYVRIFVLQFRWVRARVRKKTSSSSTLILNGEQQQQPQNNSFSTNERAIHATLSHMLIRTITEHITSWLFQHFSNQSKWNEFKKTRRANEFQSKFLFK